MTDTESLKEIWDLTDIKLLDDEIYVAIKPFLFTYAIIIGDLKDRSGYMDRWCYHMYEIAKKAFDSWNGEGEPIGWHRHPASGRRHDEYGNFYIRH